MCYKFAVNYLAMDKNAFSSLCQMQALYLFNLFWVLHVCLVLGWLSTQVTMKESVLLLLLAALCSAKPLLSPSHLTLKNMMLKDMEDMDDDDDDDDDNSVFPTKETVNPFFPFDLFPTCPFGCQCYSRVVHCSDLGREYKSTFYCFCFLRNNVILTN